MFRSRPRDPADLARLALRNIEGNVCFTRHEAWAWFVLPTQPWAFRSDTQREQLLFGFGDALSWLAGHRLHLRVTSRPYPTAEWARRLHQLTPDPLGTPGVEPWTEHMVTMQKHLRNQTMAEKEVFLGVRVANRAASHRLIGAVWRHPGNIEHARLRSQVERVTETVALPGLEGRPATAADMEWLLRRSVGLGLPAPADLSPVGDGEWNSDDLHSFADQVEYAADRLGRTVQVTGRGPRDPVERHVSVMSVGRLEEIEAPDPGHEPWLAHTDRLPFPVEWSCQFDILSGGDAKQAIQRKLLVVRDMQRHYAEHELDEPLALDRQARQAREVEDQMTRGVDVVAARVHGWFRVAVAARTEDECLERVRQVITSYRSRRVTIEHPKGQYGLLREFIPGEPVSTSAYRRRLPVLYFSAGVPMASSRLGDRRGPYVGFTAGSSRRAVMFDTHYATEERETSGLVPIVGGLGAGKSVLIGQITYEAVRRGIPSVVLDPSGPLARLTELPELREHSQHLDLTTAASGTLNPFEVVAAPLRAAYLNDEAFAEAEVLAAQDRKLLAMDVAEDAAAGVGQCASGDLAGHLGCRALDPRRPRSVPVGHRQAPRRVVEPAWTGGCELSARHVRAAVVAFVLSQGRQRSGSDVCRADGADHARAGPSASVGAAGPLVDIRAARRTPAASGFLVRDPGGVRTGDAEPQAGRARRDPLPRRVVGRYGRSSPAWAGIPESGTPVCWPRHRTPRTFSAWTSRTSWPPRSWGGSRTRTPHATVSGCCESPPASATSARSPACRPGGVQRGPGSS